MSTCLSLDDFNQRYPRGPYLSQGTYGRVYTSRDHVIKVQKWDKKAFFTELCVLTQFRHPNICPLIDMTFSSTEGYMAFPKGKSVKEAYANKEISLEEIVTDILSGLNFLNTRGIAHSDLKIDNCIYHENRVKIIDLGLAKFCEKAVFEGEVEYYMTGTAYTYPFRDPEYDEFTQNPIRSELYSVVATIYYMLTGNYLNGKYRTYYFEQKQLNTSPELFDLLIECQKPMSIRKNITELLSHPAVIQSRVEIIPFDFFQPQYSSLEALTFQSSNPNPNQMLKPRVIKVVFDWLLEWVIGSKISLQAYFLACDIVYRFLLLKIVDKNNIQLVGTAALYISLLLLNYNITAEITCDFNGSGITPEDLSKTCCTMYTVLDGNFYNHTLWETIQCEDEIINFAALMASQEYVSNRGYVFESICKDYFDKNKFRSTVSSEPKMLFDRVVIPSYTMTEYQEFPIEQRNYKLLNPDEIQRTLEKCIKPERGESETRYFERIIQCCSLYISYLNLMDESSARALFYMILENARESKSFEFLTRAAFYNKNMKDFTLAT